MKIGTKMSAASGVRSGRNVLHLRVKKISNYLNIQRIAVSSQPCTRALPLKRDEMRDVDSKDAAGKKFGASQIGSAARVDADLVQG